MLFKNLNWNGFFQKKETKTSGKKFPFLVKACPKSAWKTNQLLANRKGKLLVGARLLSKGSQKLILRSKEKYKSKTILKNSLLNSDSTVISCKKNSKSYLVGCKWSSHENPIQTLNGTNMENSMRPNWCTPQESSTIPLEFFNLWHQPLWKIQKFWKVFFQKIYTLYKTEDLNNPIKTPKEKENKDRKLKKMGFFLSKLAKSRWNTQIKLELDSSWSNRIMMKNIKSEVERGKRRKEKKRTKS